VVLSFVFLLWILSISALIVYSRYLLKHIEVIGELIVSRSMIRKSIGGLHEQFDVQRIKLIKIKILLRQIFSPSNVDKSQTYLVTFDYEGTQKEQFIISNHPPIHQ